MLENIMNTFNGWIAHMVYSFQNFNASTIDLKDIFQFIICIAVVSFVLDVLGKTVKFLTLPIRGVIITFIAYWLFITLM